MVSLPFFRILDTGATDHITYHFASFIIPQTIKHIHVTLPNGTHINAFIFGSIVFPYPLSSTMSCISQPLMSILFQLPNVLVISIFIYPSLLILVILCITPPRK